MTNINSKSKKLTPFNVATIIIVMALHGCVAAVIMNREPVQTKLPVVEQMPPIEIELLTVIEEKPSEQLELEPTEAPSLLPEPKSEPEPSLKPKLLTVKPSISKPPVFKPTVSKPSVSKPPISEPPISESQQVRVTPRQIDQQQRLKEQQDATALQAKQDATTLQAKQDAAVLQAKQDAAELQAKQEADALRAKQDAAALQAKQDAAALQAKQDAAVAISNTPQNFSVSQASWRIPPVFTFPSRARGIGRSGAVFRGTLKVTVDKQGNVMSATVAPSSGNRIIDIDASRTMMRAKLNPFTKDGVPVVGIIYIPFSYKVP